MKNRNNIFSLLQWLVVLAAMAAAMVIMPDLHGAARALLTLGVGLGCIGFAEAVCTLMPRRYRAA